MWSKAVCEACQRRRAEQLAHELSLVDIVAPPGHVAHTVFVHLRRNLVQLSRSKRSARRVPAQQQCIQEPRLGVTRKARAHAHTKHHGTHWWLAVQAMSGFPVLSLCIALYRYAGLSQNEVLVSLAARDVSST